MKQELKYLIIHCTATPEGRKVSAGDIRRWHLSPPPTGRGWKQVGYTDIVYLNGIVERLVENNEDGYVDGWEITNGAKGLNSISRHIVYVGGLDKFQKPYDTRTSEQKESLKDYIRDFVQRFPSVKIAGHNQFSTKQCPCFDVPEWLREIGISENNIYNGK